MGADLSGQAVKYGKDKYKLELYESSLSDFSYSEKFDLIIVNFVLHWVDRTDLLKSIYNIDIHLKDGGNLVLGDFLSHTPVKKIYHHHPVEKNTGSNIYTFKTNYSNIFESLGTYKTLDSVIFNCDNKQEEATKDNMSIISILKKDLTNYYKP